jgi:aldose 1-epimerase
MSPLLTVQSKTPCSINSKTWGKVEGKAVKLFTLTNSKGMVVELTNYGGIVVSVIAPDRKGMFENIVLGFDNLEQYVRENSPFMGALIGRYANRISIAEFVLDGTRYKLAPNDIPNHTHGGKKGFDKVVWEATGLSNVDSVGVVLLYQSKDMEEGYPGNLSVKVTYLLTNENELNIQYEAKTDKPTVLNLTHHSYFNLSAKKETVLNHDLTIFADDYTPTDANWMPTGEIAKVEGTDFDFTHPHKVGERIQHLPHGYNMNYVLRKNGTLSKAAEVYDAKSGRLLEVYTTEPGIQLYTADYLDGTLTSSGGVVLGKNMGLCLEAQHFPDSPNKPNFPTTVLRPGETYLQVTTYKFSIK